MKAVVFTLGCKVNEYESDSLIAALTDKGYEVSDKLEVADLYIINTCAVTAEAEKKSRQAAERVYKLNKNAEIVFIGCAAQKNYQNFVGKKNVRLISGTFGKNDIERLLNDKGVNVLPQTNVYEDLFPAKTLRGRAYVKVQDGCDNFCSYCTVPYLRGRSRSRAPDGIVEEITRCALKEAVITGINLSSYNYDGLSLTGLIKKLSGVNVRIRLGSLEARVIDEEFLTACSALKNFAPHFHLSLQSGSNEVLKKMNRRYNAEDFIEKVDLIRKFFPLAGITTDVIAGFPTETDQDFAETLSVIDRADFSDIHAFMFSPRSGTAAFNLKDLDYKVKKVRLDALLSEKEKHRTAFAEKMKGETLTVLIEEFKDGFFEGYTENYLRVYIANGVKEGEMVKVKIGEPFLGGAKAEIIK